MNTNSPESRRDVPQSTVETASRSERQQNADAFNAASLADHVATLNAAWAKNRFEGLPAPARAYLEYAVAILQEQSIVRTLEDAPLLALAELIRAAWSEGSLQWLQPEGTNAEEEGDPVLELAMTAQDWIRDLRRVTRSEGTETTPEALHTVLRLANAATDRISREPSVSERLSPFLARCVRQVATMMEQARDSAQSERFFQRLVRLGKPNKRQDDLELHARRLWTRPFRFRTLKGEEFSVPPLGYMSAQGRCDVLALLIAEEDLNTGAVNQRLRRAQFIQPKPLSGNTERHGNELDPRVYLRLQEHLSVRSLEVEHASPPDCSTSDS